MVPAPHTIDHPHTPHELTVLRAVIETVDQGVLVVDQQSQFVMCNQLFLRIWRIPDQYSADNQAMMNYVVHQLVHPELFIATIVSINSQPDSEIVDEIPFKDGRTIERYSRPIRIEGQAWRVWYFRDVTSRKVVEAQERQQDKLAALGQLVAGAAHELNNPLAAVLGLAQLMLRRPLPQDMVDDLHAVEMAAQRAKHIVSQMLTFARAQQDLRQPVDIALLIDRVVGNLHRHFQIDDIQVDINVQPHMPTILGHVYQIEQVLDNLLHNAIHALREQQQAFRYINVEASATETQVYMKVTDNGPGIPSHILPKIFDPFFTTKEVGHGTGLGLSLVYGIINKHGGTIKAESVVGQGTSFVIELPINNKPANKKASPGDRKGVALPQSILVIEDEVFVRLVIERALLEQGYQVDTAVNGRAGLEKIMSRDYDLVISDLRMPDMGGNDLFVQVHPVKPDLAWVFVTGDTMSDASESFLHESGMPYLAKPFTLDELWDTIAVSALSRYRS